MGVSAMAYISPDIRAGDIRDVLAYLMGAKPVQSQSQGHTFTDPAPTPTSSEDWWMLKGVENIVGFANLGPYSLHFNSRFKGKLWTCLYASRSNAESVTLLRLVAKRLGGYVVVNDSDDSKPEFYKRPKVTMATRSTGGDGFAGMTPTDGVGWDAYQKHLHTTPPATRAELVQGSKDNAYAGGWDVEKGLPFILTSMACHDWSLALLTDAEFEAWEKHEERDHLNGIERQKAAEETDPKFKAKWVKESEKYLRQFRSRVKMLRKERSARKVDSKAAFLREVLVKDGVDPEKVDKVMDEVRVE